MKKIFIGALCVAASLTALADNAKISPAGRMYMLEQELNPTRGGEAVKALVKMSEGYTTAELDDYEIAASLSDRMAIIEITLQEVEKLAENEAIESISFGEMVTPCLDVARKDTGVDLVQAGTGLSGAFNGKGILAGIFDTGIDPNHITFLGADGQTRVQRFYIPDSGREYTAANIASATTDNASQTHGTHCAGIMGGAYGGPGKVIGLKKILGKDRPAIVDGDVPFYGVARESDLFLSGSSLSTNNIILAVNRIADYANEQGQPAVINLSLGSVPGAHDGSSPTCEALDLVADKGALIFVAAGNDGDAKMSIKKQLSATDNAITTFATTTSQNLVEFWASNNGKITGTFGVYNKTTGEVTDIYDVDTSKEQQVIIAGSSYNNPTYIQNSTFQTAFGGSSNVIINTGVRTTNNRSYVTFSLSLSASSNYYPVLKVKGNAGQTLLATVNKGELSNYGLAGFDNGTNLENINDMATASKVISIGSYNTRLSWDIFNGSSPQTVSYNNYTAADLGKVSDFSSFGTSFDGVNFPVLCAPGMGIISSYSTYYLNGAGSSEKSYICASANANGRDNYWLCEQGTSMATPFAAGTTALWLQIKPTLTRDEVVALMKKTAVRDAAVEAGNPVQWGAGKISAIKGAQELLGLNSVGSIFEDEELRLIVENENGKNFNITVSGENGYTARLYSLSGAMVKTASTSSSQMNLDASDLSRGIYVLEIVGETAHYTKKVTVK